MMFSAPKHLPDIEKKICTSSEVRLSSLFTSIYYFKPAGFQHKHLKLGYDCLTRISWVKKTVWRLEEVILGRTKDEEVPHRKPPPDLADVTRVKVAMVFSDTDGTGGTTKNGKLEMSSIVDECDAPW